MNPQLNSLLFTTSRWMCSIVIQKYTRSRYIFIAFQQQNQTSRLNRNLSDQSSQPASHLVTHLDRLTFNKRSRCDCQWYFVCSPLMLMYFAFGYSHHQTCRGEFINKNGFHPFTFDFISCYHKSTDRQLNVLHSQFASPNIVSDVLPMRGDDTKLLKFNLPNPRESWFVGFTFLKRMWNPPTTPHITESAKKCSWSRTQLCVNHSASTVKHWEELIKVQ